MTKRCLGGAVGLSPEGTISGKRSPLRPDHLTRRESKIPAFGVRLDSHAIPDVRHSARRTAGVVTRRVVGVASRHAVSTDDSRPIALITGKRSCSTFDGLSRRIAKNVGGTITT